MISGYIFKPCVDSSMFSDDISYFANCTKRKELYNKPSPSQWSSCRDSSNVASSRLRPSSFWCSFWIYFSVLSCTKLSFKFKLKRPCRRRCRVKWMGLRLLRPFYVTTQIALRRKQQWRPTSETIFLNVIQTKAAWVIFASHLYIWYQRWSHKAYRASQSGFLLTSVLIIKRLLWENSFAMQLRGEKEGRDWWRGSEGRDRVRETEKHRGGHVWRKGEKGPERDRMIHFTSPSQLSYSVRAEGLCWSLVPCTEQAIANFIKDVISTRDLKDVSPQPSV